MATIITEECINCGACEPECPNTAIYQGGVEYEWLAKKHPALATEFFYIVPEKCTECVGFFDQEACAAVCPVDCCIPDPQRPESQELLLERAREIHPDKQFGADAPSRFRKATAVAAVVGSADSPAPGAPLPAPIAPGQAAEELPSADPDSFEVPIVCRSCTGQYQVAFRFLSPGLVLRCPHCGMNFTPSRGLHMAIRQRLERFAEILTAEVDRHVRAIEAERAVFDENIVDIHESTEREARRLVEEHTAPPKRSIFG